MPAVQSKKKKLNDGNIAECQGVHSMPSTSRNAVSRLGPVVKASGVEVHVKSLRREKGELWSWSFAQFVGKPTFKVVL